jgi:hypothetical protein
MWATIVGAAAPRQAKFEHFWNFREFSGLPRKFPRERPVHESLHPMHNLHFTQAIESQGRFGRTRDSTRESTTKRVQICTN